MVALVLLISSWRRAPSPNSRIADDGDMADADTAFFKSQLQALENDREAGLLDDEQFRVAQAELAREALAAQQNAKKSTPAGSWTMVHSAFALVAFLAIGVGTYVALGTPALKNQPLATRLAAIENLDVNDAVAKIEAQLQVTPDDLRGWRVLVPVYVRQGNVEKAIIAFENIIRLEGENADNVTDLAEAYLMQAGGEPTPKVNSLLKKAGELDPRHVRSRFYLANIALRQEEFELAKQRWQAILDIAQGDEPWVESAQNGLNAARAGLGEAESTVGPAPSQDEVEAAAQMDEADRNEMITQMVRGLADRLYTDGGNVDEWARLIRSRIVLGQQAKAEADIEAARAAFKNNEQRARALEDALAPLLQELEEEQDQ
ncbi:c-type cytochrome biogenesis protein CcmI [Maritalea sp. P4.10X]|uniref:C-type cytochrome biogenesis protein CcmI n=1 Tax=Maritalea mediterranea TaxID=2909667 RepID=A0ABS9E509_9HYPH|nr:c-type cytochrome biogenesis protein CcmI [Maritalea mediterranea]